MKNEETTDMMKKIKELEEIIEILSDRITVLSNLNLFMSMQIENLGHDVNRLDYRIDRLTEWF